MDVFKYIENYAKTHGIENYFLCPKFLQKTDAGKAITMSGGVGFFYRIFAEGTISDINNLSKKFLDVKSNTDFWPLSPVVEIVDYTTIQKVETNFVFTVDNTVVFNLYENTAESMFNNVINFCAEYMLLMPNTNAQSNDNGNIKVKVKI